MENASKAIYIAGFALLFVFAASIAIFLYGSLNTYLNETTISTNITSRAEGTTSEDMTNYTRDITRGEIYVMLYNMEQMHVEKLIVDGYTVTREDVENDASNVASLESHLYSCGNKKFKYSSTGTTVTYTSN